MYAGASDCSSLRPYQGRDGGDWRCDPPHGKVRNKKRGPHRWWGPLFLVQVMGQTCQNGRLSQSPSKSNWPQTMAQNRSR